MATRVVQSLGAEAPAGTADVHVASLKDARKVSTASAGSFAPITLAW